MIKSIPYISRTAAKLASASNATLTQPTREASNSTRKEYHHAQLTSQSENTVPTDETVIDETINRSYACGIRATIHAFWNTSIDWGDLYFDCETGILVELHRTHRFVDNGTGEVVDKTDVIKISSTNRGQVTQNNQQSLKLLFAVLTIIIFGLLSLWFLSTDALQKNP
jgi:hypothetical protein